MSVGLHQPIRSFHLRRLASILIEEEKYFCVFDHRSAQCMDRWFSNSKRVVVKVRIPGASMEKRLAKIEQELAQLEVNERLKIVLAGRLCS